MHFSTTPASFVLITLRGGHDVEVIHLPAHADGDCGSWLSRQKKTPGVFPHDWRSCKMSVCHAEAQFRIYYRACICSASLLHMDRKSSCASPHQALSLNRDRLASRPALTSAHRVSDCNPCHRDCSHCPAARPIPPSNAVALALDVPTPGTNPVSFSNEREPKQRVDSPIGSARCAVLCWISQRCRL